MACLPSSEYINEIIQMLIDRKESRESISAWAISIIDDDFVRVTNKTAWEIIQNLGAVDLMVSDDEYFYDLEDFKIWQEELFNG
ncbi:hypothetical protein L0B52_09030 [Suttonella sp. R2A3]|uniref:hypothetical protein n=1 Tax=Suttonella sp. R2A3 TaxID=2908648 RepID=UPI001F3F963A|nr:hypothetical protein [Suttonella sp. R2A3]UJF24457.1 hypothetical protein L0B52_09030 [Suttonella sp. R2A3]